MSTVIAIVAVAELLDIAVAVTTFGQLSKICVAKLGGIYAPFLLAADLDFQLTIGAVLMVDDFSRRG